MSKLRVSDDGYLDLSVFDNTPLSAEDDALLASFFENLGIEPVDGWQTRLQEGLSGDRGDEPTGDALDVKTVIHLDRSDGHRDSSRLDGRSRRFQLVAALFVLIAGIAAVVLLASRGEDERDVTTPPNPDMTWDQSAPRWNEEYWTRGGLDWTPAADPEAVTGYEVEIVNDGEDGATRSYTVSSDVASIGVADAAPGDSARVRRRSETRVGPWSPWSGPFVHPHEAEQSRLIQFFTAVPMVCDVDDPTAMMLNVAWTGIIEEWTLTVEPSGLVLSNPPLLSGDPKAQAVVPVPSRDHWTVTLHARGSRTDVPGADLDEVATESQRLSSDEVDGFACPNTQPPEAVDDRISVIFHEDWESGSAEVDPLANDIAPDTMLMAGELPQGLSFSFSEPGGYGYPGPPPLRGSISVNKDFSGSETSFDYTLSNAIGSSTATVFVEVVRPSDETVNVRQIGCGPATAREATTILEYTWPAKAWVDAGVPLWVPSADGLSLRVTESPFTIEMPDRMLNDGTVPLQVGGGHEILSPRVRNHAPCG